MKRTSVNPNKTFLDKEKMNKTTFWKEYRKENTTFIPIDLILGVGGLFFILIMIIYREKVSNYIFPLLLTICGLGLFFSKYFEYRKKGKRR